MSDAIIKVEPQEHWVHKFVRRATESVEKKVETSPAKSYVHGAVTTGEVFLEGASVDSLLGATRARFGAKAASQAAGTAAGVSALLALASAGTHPGVAERARTVGGQAAAVALAWETESFLGGGRRGSIEAPLIVKTVGSGSAGAGKGGAAVHGEIENDPVLAAAAKRKQP